LVSCLGMKLSPAWKEARRGKSAKEVFAASTRISIVPACRAKKRIDPKPLAPKTCLATCEMTVG